MHGFLWDAPSANPSGRSFIGLTHDTALRAWPAHAVEAEDILVDGMESTVTHYSIQALILGHAIHSAVNVRAVEVTLSTFTLLGEVRVE
jgi:hypothetical protein